MRQTLFYLPSEVFGIPVFGAGLLFWILLIVGFFTVVRSLLRKNSSDAIFYATIVAIGIFFVRSIGARVVEADGFPIRGYGVFLLLAIVLSTWLTIARGKKWNYPSNNILTIVFVGAFFGILGARTFYVLQYWREVQGATVGETLINAIDLTSGGLVVYGSIIGGIISVIVLLCVKGWPLFATLDLFAPSLALGIAIGRLGCLMNGCCFGGVCDLPWAIVFPNGSPAHIQQTSEGVISLYGITLQLPQENQNDKNLFSLKTKHTNLAADIPGPVIIESVDPESDAEKADIRPGSRICELGLVPSGLFDSNSNLNSAASRKEIRRFEVRNNAQVFYFFQSMWNCSKDFDVLMVLQEHKKDGAPGAYSVRNIIFHPKPSVARPVHPTQLYSSFSALCVCGLLLLLSRFVKRDGVVFAGFLLLYPATRFCLELIRTDEESFCGTGLTVSQCVSVVVAAIGVCLLVFIMVRPAKRALLGYFDSSENTNEPKKDENKKI